jgi:hypothetical protein
MAVAGRVPFLSRGGTIDCECHTSIKPPEFSEEREIPEQSGAICDLKLPLYL